MIHAMPRRLAVLLALLVCACTAASAEAAVTPSLQWASEPTPIDNLRPHGKGYGLSAAACPATDLCVGIDGEGNSYVSTAPHAGVEAWSLRKLPLKAQDIACPTKTFCAIAGGGGIATTTDPVNGTWTVTTLGGHLPIGIECPATNLCVAYSNAGTSVYTATNPTGGAAAWTARTLPVFAFRNLSCPTTTLCVGGGYSASLYTTTNPTGDASAWKETFVQYLGQPTVDCPTASFCIAVSDQGRMLATSTNPTGGSDAWTLSTLNEPPNAQSLRCASSTLCFLSHAGGGTLYTSTNPAAGADSFNFASGNLASPSVLDCVGTALCLATSRDERGGLFTSTTPATGADDWDYANLEPLGWEPLLGVACPSASRCLAVDGGGRVLASTTPTGPAESWIVESDLSALGADGLLAIGCAPSRCVAGDVSGGLFERDAAGAWRRAAAATGAAVYGVACAGDALCMAVDEAGHARRGDGTSWRTELVAATELNSVACPSAALCVVAGDNGRVYRTQAGGWTSLSVAVDDPLVSVACPSPALCVAGDGGGRVFTTVAPASDVEWLVTELDTTGVIFGLACPSVSLCVAVDDTGAIHTSSEPSTGAPWAAVEPWKPHGRFTAVGCAADSACLAVDDLGYAFVGAGRGVPYAATGPSIEPVATLRDTLHCHPGVWNGFPALSYEWEFRGRLIPGETRAFYTPRAVDEGQPISCRVTARSGFGVAAATSGATFIGAPAPPPLEPAPIAPVPSPGPTLPLKAPLAPFTASVTPRATRLATLLSRGLPVRLRCSTTCRLTVKLAPDAATARRLGLGRSAVLGTGTFALGGGTVSAAQVRLSKTAARAIKRAAPRSVRFTLRVTEAERRPVSATGAVTVRR